jgi:hypothetical protein
MKYIVVFGDVNNGFTFHGPFGHVDDAQDYGELNREEDTDYTIAELTMRPPS